MDLPKRSKAEEEKIGFLRGARCIREATSELPCSTKNYFKLDGNHSISALPGHENEYYTYHTEAHSQCKN